MLESVFGMHPTVLLELVTIPLFTGVIGYITNWTGILMLFKPVAFHGIRLPGLRALFPFLPKRIQVLPLLSKELHPLTVQALLTEPQLSLTVNGRPVSIVAWRTGSAGAASDIEEAAAVITAADWESA